MDINAHLAHRVRALRDARQLSLDALAERSGVCRSHISLVERGQSSPTASVLDKLATGLGVTIASMFDAAETDAGAPPSPLLRADEQPLWTDPASGYTRRKLSPPAAGGPLQLVEVVFPAGRRVAFETAGREPEVHQQVWLLDGAMEIRVGDARWRLAAGDCLAMRLNAAITFRNPGRVPARYLVALATLPAHAPRRSPA